MNNKVKELLELAQKHPNAKVLFLCEHDSGCGDCMIFETISRIDYYEKATIVQYGCYDRCEVLSYGDDEIAELLYEQFDEEGLTDEQVDEIIKDKVERLHYQEYIVVMTGYADLGQLEIYDSWRE